MLGGRQELVGAANINFTDPVSGEKTVPRGAVARGKILRAVSTSLFLSVDASMTSLRARPPANLADGAFIKTKGL
jgi:hypothetical protein